MDNLKMFSNGYDVAIAATEEEAKQMTATLHGYEEYSDELDGDGWFEYDSDQLFNFCEDTDSYPLKYEKKPVQEWIGIYGAGYLGGTEW